MKKVDIEYEKLMVEYVNELIFNTRAKIVSDEDGDQMVVYIYNPELLDRLKKDSVELR